MFLHEASIMKGFFLQPTIQEDSYLEEDNGEQVDELGNESEECDDIGKHVVAYVELSW